MKPTASVIVAILGVGFALMDFFAVAKTLYECFANSRQIIALPGADPSQLAAVIGETIIAVVCRGLFAILPASLLYVALVPMRLRAGWFYSCTRIASFYFLLVVPFATVYGIILLIALRRRRSEFIHSANPLPTTSSNEVPPQT